MGLVRGTFGLQLSNWILVTPSHYSGKASIEEGGFGFYKFIDSFKQRQYSGQDLKTEKAREEVEHLLTGLKESGFKVATLLLSWIRMGVIGEETMEQKGRTTGRWMFSSSR